MSLHINRFICPQLKGAVTYRKTVYRTVLELVAYPWDASILSYLILYLVPIQKKTMSMTFYPLTLYSKLFLYPEYLLYLLLKLKIHYYYFFLSTLKSKVDFASYKHVIDVINIYTHNLHWIFISKAYRGFV